MVKLANRILLMASVLASGLSVARQYDAPPRQPVSGDGLVDSHQQADDRITQRVNGEWTEDDQLLSAYHWRLQRAVDQKGRRIKTLFASKDWPLQLDFTHQYGEGLLGVRHSCNAIGGLYHIVNGRMEYISVSRTLLGCEGPIFSNLDDEIESRLSSNARIQIHRGENPQVRLLTDSGETLDFAGTPTGETRYGSKGEFVHLEVDAQKRPCRRSPFGDGKCLLVRERFYEDSGLESSVTGEWELLHQNIEGYKHMPGQNVVLNVKRFKMRNPPSNAPSTVLMLSGLD